MFWRYDIPVDIDLWLKTPEEDKPIYYNHKSNTTASLLRDDQGLIKDAFDRNDEIAFVRGLLDGEYIINIHFFSPGPGWDGEPILVKTRITLRKETSMRMLSLEKNLLVHPKDEYTVYRFTLKDGVVVKESNRPMVLAHKWLSGNPRAYRSQGGAFNTPND